MANALDSRARPSDDSNAVGSSMHHRKYVSSWHCRRAGEEKQEDLLRKNRKTFTEKQEDLSRGPPGPLF
jgi:hypothetical protein